MFEHKKSYLSESDQQQMAGVLKIAYAQARKFVLMLPAKIRDKLVSEVYSMNSVEQKYQEKYDWENKFSDLADISDYFMNKISSADDENVYKAIYVGPERKGLLRGTVGIFRKLGKNYGCKNVQFCSLRKSDFNYNVIVELRKWKQEEGKYYVPYFGSTKIGSIDTEILNGYKQFSKSELKYNRNSTVLTADYKVGDKVALTMTNNKRYWKTTKKINGLEYSKFDNFEIIKVNTKTIKVKVHTLFRTMNKEQKIGKIILLRPNEIEKI